LDAIAAGEGLASLSVANAETLTLSADDDTADGTGTLTIASLTATDATTINISGDSALTITTAVNPSTAILATLSAGTMTDALTLSGTNFASGGATVTLGSGADVINVGTASGADTFDIAAGGNDRFVYTALAQSDTDEDTITGFTSGSDDVDLRTFTAQTVTAATQFGGVGIDLATAQSLLGGANAAVVVFQADANRLWLDVNADGVLNSSDFRVTLTDVATVTAADLSLVTTGNTISLSAAAAVLTTALSTNATAATTTAGDTITSPAANIVGSTINGDAGADTLTINSGTAAVDLSAAATIANIETVVTTSGVTTLTVAAGDTGAGAGNLNTITGLTGTAQTLVAAATDDLTDVTIRGFTTLSDGGATAAATYTLDSDNLTDVTTINFAGGTADSFNLADGTYDFSSITFTKTAASTLDLNTDGNGAKTVTADAADLNNITTITGEATAVVTTLNINDTDDIGTSHTVTNIDVVTIGTSANTNQTLSVAANDITATQFTTITGSGDDNLTTIGANNADLTNTTVSGIDVINVANTATGDLILDNASISGAVTLTAAATTDLLLTVAGDYTNLTSTEDDFDTMVLTGGATVQTYTATEALFGDNVSASSIIAVNGSGAATDPALLINMTGTAFLGTSIVTGAIADVDITVTGTSGNDTITAPDTTTSGSAFNIATGTGSDTVQVRKAAGNATPADSTTTVVIADAIRITDFDAGNDVFAIDISDGVGINASVGSAASGAANFITGAGFQLITGTALNDFSNGAGVISAVGNYTAANNDQIFFAVQNVSGSQVGVYSALNNIATAGAVLDADDGITLVAVIDVTSGTFGTANMGVF
jgi:hypothetical protein